MPLPWSGEHPPFGFSPDGASTWLPQPASWRELTVQKQLDDPDSMLSLYRRLLSLRRTLPALHDETFEWLTAPTAVLAFRRDDVTCVINLSDEEYDASAYGDLIATSAPSGTALVQPGDAAWLLSAPPVGDALPAL